MNTDLKRYFKNEINQFKNASAREDHVSCFFHLGRAHILSQKSVVLHLKVHLIMLRYSFKRKDAVEFFGQILRLFVTIPGHLFGKVPVGNIGWSTVGLTEQMPVPEDLKKIYFS